MTTHRFAEHDLAAVTTLLCDADGTLFPSEEPAFAASAGVVNEVLGSLGLPGTYDGEELRRAAPAAGPGGARVAGVPARP